MLCVNKKGGGNEAVWCTFALPLSAGIWDHEGGDDRGGGCVGAGEELLTERADKRDSNAHMRLKMGYIM